MKNTDEIKEVLEFAEKNKLKIFILGGGSNLLISDKGFDGLVIRITNHESRITDDRIFVGAGVSLSELVSESVKNNLTGLEWTAGIPGTVGGAVVDNAGAYNKSMSDVVEWMEVLDIGYWILRNKEIGNWKLEIRKLDNKQCQFSYRDSVFKKEKKFIILSAVLKLEKGNQDKSRRMIAEILKSRKEKQPLEYPSAGSVFKNLVIDDGHFKKLIKKYPELKNIIKNNIIPAGWLIEKAD